MAKTSTHAPHCPTAFGWEKQAFLVINETTMSASPSYAFRFDTDRSEKKGVVNVTGLVISMLVSFGFIVVLL